MDGVVRVRTISFTPDRTPTLRRIKLGFEGDNLVERLEFILPEIAQSQTATLLITGADAVKLDKVDNGRYAVDLTRDMIGPDGEREAYVRIDGAGEEVWQSAPMRLITGALPDVEEEIEKVYPTAVGQMLTAMAEHTGEMAAQEERVEQAAQRAEDAAKRAESGGGGGGSGAPGKDGGYYQPSVTDGVLTWTPSKTDMPSVPASDVRGPAGQDGQPGRDGADGTPGLPGKTAYQYAQDGGYTGTEAEFAAKLAEELPEPYTLPTASESVKGGVKVGKGLVMDGEALGVEPEGEYELIQTIQVSESGLSEIIIDGVALESVRITILTGTCDATANSFLRMYTKNGHEPTLGTAYFVKGANIAIRYELYKNGNIWDGYSTGGTWGNGGTELIGMNRQNELMSAVDDYITKIRFYTYGVGATYPVGAVINIYGVRHNA